MAYLRRVPRSPFWIAGFTLPDGRRTQRSTKTSDRRLAMKLANEWEEAARRRITETQARRVLSDIHEQVHGTALVAASYADYQEQWIGRKRAEVASSTLGTYEHVLREFGEYLGERTTQSLQYITSSIVAKWRDLASKRTAPGTVNNKLKALRVFFQSAWREGLMPENPAAKVTILKAPPSNRRPFTASEIKKLLSVANDEWRGMVLAGIYTGQRLKDVASLTWANIDLENREIRLVTSKTHRRQVIPLAAPLRKFILSLPSSDDPQASLFPSAHRIVNRQSGTSALSQQFFDLMVAAGLAKPRPPKSQSTGRGRTARRTQSEITFHSLRHTATSMLKNAGVPEAVARDIIGHDSAEISRHYTHIDDQAKRAAMARLPDLTR